MNKGSRQIIADLEAEIKQLKLDHAMERTVWGAWVKTLEENGEKQLLGLKAVRELIDYSDGVIGLHQNGNIATWGELETGGRFDGWLDAFTQAEGLVYYE